MKPPWKAAFVDRPAPGWTRPSQAFKDGIFMWVQGVFAGNIMIIMGYSNLETWEVREMILRMMSQVFGDTLWSRLFMLHLLATFLVSNWCSSFWPPWVLPGSPRSTESIDILFDITGHTFRSEVRIISKTDSKLIFIILSLQHPPPKKKKQTWYSTYLVFNIFNHCLLVQSLCKNGKMAESCWIIRQSHHQQPISLTQRLDPHGSATSACLWMKSSPSLSHPNKYGGLRSQSFWPISKWKKSINSHEKPPLFSISYCTCGLHPQAIMAHCWIT